MMKIPFTFQDSGGNGKGRIEGENVFHRWVVSDFRDRPAVTYPSWLPPAKCRDVIQAKWLQFWNHPAKLYKCNSFDTMYQLEREVGRD